MSKYKTSVHPMVIFWLGVLTGALVVGLVFTYQVIGGGDMASNTFRSVFNTSRTTESISLPGLGEAVTTQDISLPGLGESIDTTTNISLPGL